MKLMKLGNGDRSRVVIMMMIGGRRMIIWMAGKVTGALGGGEVEVSKMSTSVHPIGEEDERCLLAKQVRKKRKMVASVLL